MSKITILLSFWVFPIIVLMGVGWAGSETLFLSGLGSSHIFVSLEGNGTLEIKWGSGDQSTLRER